MFAKDRLASNKICLNPLLSKVSPLPKKKVSVLVPSDRYLQHLNQHIYLAKIITKTMLNEERAEYSFFFSRN